MKNIGMRVGLAALVAVLFIGSPSRANDPELKNDDVSKALRELRADLEKMKTLHKMTNLELSLMNARLDRIEQALARLSAAASTRTASSFTPGGPGAPAATAATGTVRLDNRLAVTASVTIDGTVYTVPAFSVRDLVGVPAGAITYSVTADGYGVRPAVRTPLAANERLTLTIY
jgi:hypothetical protein